MEKDEHVDKFECNVLLDGSRTEPETNQVSTERSEPPGVMSILCLVMLKRRLWLLPILTSGWLFSSFWISYGIAVSYNHTEANFPYISHTAIEAPERCVFGQMVNIGAVMLAMNVILRYLYLKKYFLCKQVKVTDRCFKVNLAGLVLGFASAFGLSMVANFQTEVQRIPHYIGAFFAFGVGTVYCWIQTILSFRVRNLVLGVKISDHQCRKVSLVLLQFVNSVAMTVLLVLFATSKAIYKVQSYKGKGSKWDSLRLIYLTSTVSEWLLALSILTFTLTFAPNFKKVRMHDPHIHLEEEYEKKHSISMQGDISANNNSNGAIPNGTADNVV